MVKQTVTKFKAGKPQVYNILRAESKKKQWLNCNTDSIKQIIRKTGDEDITEIVLD
jgi:hypothetical protein